MNWKVRRNDERKKDGRGEWEVEGKENEWVESGENWKEKSILRKKKINEDNKWNDRKIWDG